MRSVLELTKALPPEVADTVERVALDAAAAAMADGTVSTNAEVRRRMRRVRDRLHPEALADRRARAADERRVCVDHTPDGMAWLSLFLEAERALAITQRLDAVAAYEASGDPRATDTRTTTQRAVDLAADLLLGGALADDERTQAGATGAVQPRINVTVPVMTPLEAPERMARDARIRRDHALDFASRAPAADASRAAVQAGRGG